MIQLELFDELQTLFNKIILPKSVYDELSVIQTQKEKIDNCSWITVKRSRSFNQNHELLNMLDLGETEAVLLTIEMSADLLIIDEKKGRAIATEKGLKIIGLIGILILLKRNGTIESLKPAIHKLTNEIGFRLSENLIKKVLEAVNEA
ncbi:MAG: DUF3368 domain-containing protein [Bacteroidia bacterium]